MHSIKFQSILTAYLDFLMVFFAAKAQEEKAKGVTVATDGQENKPKKGQKRGQSPPPVSTHFKKNKTSKAGQAQVQPKSNEDLQRKPSPKPLTSNKTQSRPSKTSLASVQSPIKPTDENTNNLKETNPEPQLETSQFLHKRMTILKTPWLRSMTTWTIMRK
ncbi:hypothetical protein RYX36_020098 [Vicia faba]